MHSHLHRADCTCCGCSFRCNLLQLRLKNTNATHSRLKSTSLCDLVYRHVLNSGSHSLKLRAQLSLFLAKMAQRVTCFTNNQTHRTSATWGTLAAYATTQRSKTTMATHRTSFRHFWFDYLCGKHEIGRESLGREGAGCCRPLFLTHRVAIHFGVARTSHGQETPSNTFSSLF